MPKIKLHAVAKVGNFSSCLSYHSWIPVINLLIDMALMYTDVYSLQGTTAKVLRQRSGRNSPYARCPDGVAVTNGSQVLKTLWTEAAGQPRPPTGQWSQSSALLSQNKDVYAVAYGEYAFSKVKRFIVMAEGDRSCTAMSVNIVWCGLCGC